MPEIHIDALLPQEMATRAEYIGVRKAETPPLKVFALAVLAGAFIALGAVFATTVSTGSLQFRGPAGEAWTAPLPFGIQRVLAGSAFCLGLVLVVVGGAELFTGNNLIVMAWASRKVTTAALLRKRRLVYPGNLVGSIGTAYHVIAGGQHGMAGGAVGAAALDIARAKTGLGFGQAVALGILCNALVCLAVWMVYSARSTVDKIAAVLFPIAAFVASGFEHCVANMYFIPYAILVRERAEPAFWEAARRDPAAYASVDWAGFLGNLLPVTLGNVVGGAVLVAAVYWAVFLRKGPEEKA